MNKSGNGERNQQSKANLGNGKVEELLNGEPFTGESHNMHQFRANKKETSGEFDP